MIRKLLNQISDLAWTVGGVGLVLITLSGPTLKWGIWISIASFVLHIVGVLVETDE
jgi:hypothetical protein